VAPAEPPVIQFVSLERVRIRIQFQKEYPKLVRELQRDTEIVALFKRISDECMIARPDAAIVPMNKAPNLKVHLAQSRVSHLTASSAPQRSLPR